MEQGGVYESGEKLQELHKSSIFFYNFIHCRLHFYFFELLGSQPDKSHKSFFFLYYWLLCTEILNEIEVYILVYGWVSSFVSCGERK